MSRAIDRHPHLGTGTLVRTVALLFSKAMKWKVGEDMPERQGNRIIETTTEARAGVTGRGGRFVLAISTIATAVFMLGVYLYFFW